MRENTYNFKPERNQKCLCGSGKKYKKCCYLTLKNEWTSFEAFEAFNDENFQNALKLCRADITQYTIWHKRHTEPLISQANETIIEELLIIDIHALSSLVELLMECYEATGSIEKFPKALNLLEHNINDLRWKQEIIYYRTLVTLGQSWDKDSGKNILKQVGSINQIYDPKILKLFINLFDQELSFSAKMDLIERIIKYSDESLDRLIYRGAKGLELFLIDDKKTATLEFERSVQEFRKESSPNLTSIESFYLASNLEFFKINLNIIKNQLICIKQHC